MTNWNLIQHQADHEDLRRFKNCTVSFRRGRTTATGTLESVDPVTRQIGIKGIPMFHLRLGDLFYYDSDAGTPQPLFNSEEKELAGVFYKAYLKVRGGPSWEDISDYEKVGWYSGARAALEWVDGPVPHLRIPKIMQTPTPEEDPEDTTGAQLQLAVAKKLADQRMEAWDIAVHDGNDVAFMKDAEEIIELISKEQGT